MIENLDGGHINVKKIIQNFYNHTSTGVKDIIIE